MRYSVKILNICIYIKEYGFLSFAKNMDKCLSNKYGLKLRDGAKNLQQMQ